MLLAMDARRVPDAEVVPGQVLKTAQKKSAEEKKRDEQKMRLVVRELAAHPSADGQTINTLKPGHWYQGKQEIKATNRTSRWT